MIGAIRPPGRVKTWEISQPRRARTMYSLTVMVERVDRVASIIGRPLDTSGGSMAAQQMTTMRFGVYCANFGFFGEARPLIDIAVLAEECDWDGFFVYDHLVPFPDRAVS